MRFPYFAALFVLLFLFSFSFASLLWTFDTNGPVSVQPIPTGNETAIASQDGNLYLISQTGTMVWKKSVGNYLLQPLVFGENIVAVTTAGHFVELKREGTIVRDIQLNSTHNVSYVYGIAADSNKIYITTTNSVIALNKTGQPYIFYKITKNTIVLTAPAIASDGTVIFGIDDTLTAVKDGKAKWNATVGTTWKSRPVILGNFVYIGTLDGALYAVSLDSGSIAWKKDVDGWVIGNLLASGQILYFGTTSGSFYALDTATAGVMWKKALPGGIASTPTKGTIGGKEAVFVGSDNSNLYVLDAQNGRLLWAWSARGKAGSPLFYQAKLILPSYDGSVYGLSTDKACFISEPKDSATIGPKEVKMSGTVVSEGNKDVYIRYEGGQWRQASVNNEEWTFLLDPTPLTAGVNIMECKVGADEQEPSFSYSLNYDKNIPLGKFNLVYPATVEAGKEFNISVSDADTNLAIDNFTAIYEGKTVKATGNLALKLNQQGKSKVTIKKIGFHDSEITIDAKSGIDIIPIAVGLLIFLAIVYFYFFIYKRK